MKRASSLIVALFLVVAAAYANGPEGDTVKWSFKVLPGGTLYLDIDIGNVKIGSTSDDAVHVIMDRIVDGVDSDDLKRILELHEYDVDQDGNDVIIESHFYRDKGDDSWSWRRWRKRNPFRLKVTVLVPQEYDIDFRMDAGNVDIEDLTGEIVGRTGAGNIDIGEIYGSVDVSSGSGNITIESIVGYARIRSGAGNIEIDEVAGEIYAKTGAGNIIATLTRQPLRASELTSGAGNVIVYMDEDIAVDVDAHASVGSARCDFGLKVTGKWMSKSFAGRINGGGPELSLRSGVGNVSLRRK